VVETVFLDWPLAFGAGLLFGLVGLREVSLNPPGFRTRAFRWGLLYLHLGIIAVSVSAYAVNPDWMWMYYVDARSLPIVVIALVFAMYEAAFIAGFLLGPALERARRGAGIAFAIATGIGITLAEALSRARLGHFGTLDQFRSGTAKQGLKISPFHLEPLMGLLLIAGVVSTIAIAVLAVGVYKRARIVT
jgi:hypothetical protein